MCFLVSNPWCITANNTAPPASLHTSSVCPAHIFVNGSRPTPDTCATCYHSSSPWAFVSRWLASVLCGIRPQATYYHQFPRLPIPHGSNCTGEKRFPITMDGQCQWVGCPEWVNNALYAEQCKGCGKATAWSQGRGSALWPTCKHGAPWAAIQCTSAVIRQLAKLLPKHFFPKDVPDKGLKEPISPFFTEFLHTYILELKILCQKIWFQPSLNSVFKLYVIMNVGNERVKDPNVIHSHLQVMRNLPSYFWCWITPDRIPSYLNYIYNNMKNLPSTRPWEKVQSCVFQDELGDETMIQGSNFKRSWWKGIYLPLNIELYWLIWSLNKIPRIDKNFQEILQVSILGWGFSCFNWLYETSNQGL
jgi:hypothetical protein